MTCCDDQAHFCKTNVIQFHAISTFNTNIMLQIQYLSTIGITAKRGAFIMAYSGIAEAVFSFLISITGI